MTRLPHPSAKLTRNANGRPHIEGAQPCSLSPIYPTAPHTRRALHCPPPRVQPRAPLTAAQGGGAHTTRHRKKPPHSCCGPMALSVDTRVSVPRCPYLPRLSALAGFHELQDPLASNPVTPQCARGNRNTIAIPWPISLLFLVPPTAKVSTRSGA